MSKTFNECLQRLSKAFQGVPEETEFDLPEDWGFVEGNLEYPAFLNAVMADKAGRLWVQDYQGRKLKMIFDPNK